MHVIKGHSFFQAQNPPKIVWRSVSARTRWGKLTSLPRPPSWILRVGKREGRKMKERGEGKEMERRGGSEGMVGEERGGRPHSNF